MSALRPQPLPVAGAELRARVPRIAVAGEANSGKTTLVNLLLQSQLLVADIVANTPCPTLVRFGETAHLRLNAADGSSSMRPLAELRRLGREQLACVEVILPNPILRGLEILDLPGFASRAEAEAHAHWLAGADLAIWCTAATQAWKASEHAMWLSLRSAPARSFLVLTHRDLLSQAQLAEVGARMTRETRRFFADWTAIAAPQAVNTRFAPAEGGAASGVEDFASKLRLLLQAAAAQPRQLAATAEEPAPPTFRAPPVAVLAPALAAATPASLAATPAQIPAPASVPAAIAHPLISLALIRRRVLAVAAETLAPAEAAALLARELEGFAQGVIRPWLRAQNLPPEAIAAVAGFIPTGEAELAVWVEAGQPGLASLTKILKQIEGELREELNAHVSTVRSNAL
jgi:hypothetical protein